MSLANQRLMIQHRQVPRCIGLLCFSFLLLKLFAAAFIVLLQLCATAPPAFVKLFHWMHPGAQLAEPHGDAVLGAGPS
eukprot:scaffold199163_cov46-Prasinocladus_malaysianus.AAC.2